MKDPTPVIAIVLEGHMVIEIVRKMAGSTNPLKAAPGTIRGDFSQDSYVLSDYFKRPTANVIHASDSPETAKREINVWFKPEELISYSNLHDKLSYFWNTLQ
jgi:nucleoside-diphosphate kinase